VESLRPLQHRWETAEGVVALTFDDGPSEWTIPILDLLSRHDNWATFFVVGRHITEQHEATLRRVVAAGGELGTHSFTHPANIGKLPVAELRGRASRRRNTSRRSSSRGRLASAHFGRT
jgi:peptidoglycan/xylan/chitin deacetylase (PgdA/CDA1 family)